jgi:hypothetical protein
MNFLGGAVRVNVGADSQGTSSFLYGDDLKPELCGLFPESVLSALYGFFVATVKDTLVVRFLGAEQVVNNSSQFVRRGGDCLITPGPRDFNSSRIHRAGAECRRGVGTRMRGSAGAHCRRSSEACATTNRSMCMWIIPQP